MAEQGNPLPTCDPNCNPIAARRSNPFSPRRAIDPNGHTGWLYDAYIDQVLSNSNINFNTQWINGVRSPECFLKRYNPDEPDNLLKWCNMHHGLRLSIALQMTPTNGISALFDHSHAIDKYTRFMVYCYYSRTEYVADDIFKSWNQVKSRRPNNSATHVIVFVNWGIDAVVILQLPPNDEHIEAIDYVLQKICISLESDQNKVPIFEEDEGFLNKILHTEVFSNIPQLNKIDSILEFHRLIPSVKCDSNLHKPYNYNLYPIDYFYAANDGNPVLFNELQQNNVFIIESYFVQLSMDFKKLSKPLNQDYPNLQQHLNIEFNKIQTSWNELQAAYTNQIVRLQDLVIRARRGDIDQNYIPDALKDDQDKTLAKMINDCNDYLNAWDQKEQLIKDLVQKGFKYQNALDRNIKSGDDQQTLNGKLSTSDNRTCVICSNDNLYKNNSSRWHSLRDQLLKQREEDPQLQLIYVDFSYCSYKLDDMKVFSTGEAKNYESTPQPMSSLPLVQPKSEEIMNVLLLGESGVGKSTFINAFVNYLKFNNLQEAEKNTIVLIPVSFMMTTGDNFEEHLVKFEGKDDLSNEDHEHLGQSVTQHCKSYVFTLTDERSRGRKLRIVDTPGIGDTRGSSQDDANLQHILTYINNLTHLNAICILLKPNNARLNVFFRSCFMQLIDMLSENICDKIIFCFTNSRPAFYTPGNTATPLKALLQSLPIKTISFKQENTFCFDSESFRYLVARRNKIVFNDIEEQEYYDSWQKSSKESGRLIAYIRTKISTGIDPNQSYSVKQAQLKIYLMSRPILESMRNILRNIILSNVSKSRKVSLKLYPKTIRSPIAICLKCPRESIKIAEFWFTMDKLHVFINNKCRTCQCDPSDHYPIDYELVYKQTDDLSSKSENDIMNMLNDLCKTSAEFAHFLLESGGSSEHDPFLLGWKRMIQEEDDICAKKCSYELNFKLMQELQQLKDGYEKTKREMARRKESIELVDVYKKIENMSKCEMIELQMVAIREWHKNMIIYYEYEVPT